MSRPSHFFAGLAASLLKDLQHRIMLTTPQWILLASIFIPMLTLPGIWLDMGADSLVSIGTFANHG